MKRVLILVEGQTEERFVKDVLAPSFYSLDLFIEATLLVTKRIKDGPNFTGGVTTYSRMHNDLSRLLQKPGGALVTTLIDYYGLPGDTPGMTTRPSGASPVERVKHVEDSVHTHLGKLSYFLPFFALHEFEAWLFSCPNTLPKVLAAEARQTSFEAICSGFASPEEINEGASTAPSKRIIGLFPGYRKVLHGPNVAQRIGLEKMRSKCAHLNEWVNTLEQFALK